MPSLQDGGGCFGALSTGFTRGYYQLAPPGQGQRNADDARTSLVRFPGPQVRGTGGTQPVAILKLLQTGSSQKQKARFLFGRRAFWFDSGSGCLHAWDRGAL